MTYYKLCFINDNKYCSAVAEKYKTEYKLNEWTYPKIGKLFVFEDLDCLYKFGKNLIGGFEFSSKFGKFACEVKNPQPCETICFVESEIKIFWENMDICRFTTYPPTGTIQCDAVKLLGRL